MLYTWAFFLNSYKIRRNECHCDMRKSYIQPYLFPYNAKKSGRFGIPTKSVVMDLIGVPKKSKIQPYPFPWNS